MEERAEIPEEIRQKVEAVKTRIGNLLRRADSYIVEPGPKRVSFRYAARLPRDFLTPDERAQSICFVTRYEVLPVIDGITLEKTDHGFYLSNMSEIRFALHEYRPILMNQNDSMYFRNIHRFCRSKLINREETKDLTITVFDEDERDVTMAFTKQLDQEMKAIRIVLSGCEYEYLYNGILQHSDHRYTSRYLHEYHSGQLNYAFLAHALPLGYFRARLGRHYRLINMLTFPKPGPL